MKELSFEIELRWSGTGREGAGEIQTDDIALELSAPESMGGRGVGTNPEELLVCAVSSCYTATLFGVLRRAKLPADSVAVNAKGTVTGISGHVRLRASPSARQSWGRLGPSAGVRSGGRRCARSLFHRPHARTAVSYEVGAVQVRDGAAVTINHMQALSHCPGRRASRSRIGYSRSSA